MSTLDTILSFLQGKGLTPAQAAGVAGNLQVESGFDPAAYNAREGAIGLAQWENGRRTNLQNYARATGGSETNLVTQLNFLWQELQGPESGALTRLQATNDPGTAAAVFDQYYERSSGSARSVRVANANAIAAGGGPVIVKGTSVDTGNPITNALGDVVDKINPFDNWASDGLTLGVKLLAVCVAGALVVVGITHTVSD